MQHHWALDKFLLCLGLWALISRHQGESLSLGLQGGLGGEAEPRVAWLLVDSVLSIWKAAEHGI